MEWYPTPSYLLKRKVILDFVCSVQVRDFLEVGCGAGDLLAALGSRGYQGMGIDISTDALAAARKRVSFLSIVVEQMEVAEVSGQFDLVIASEVLEHCEDDVGLLQELKLKLRTGAYLLLTVPAHMAKWGANDDFCGHLRRYERQELHDKLVAAGLHPVSIQAYGVPLYNLMKPFYDRAIRKKLRDGLDQRKRTEESSGMWLFTGMRRVFPLLFNNVVMSPFYLLQRLFFNSDLGNGYFVVAQKRPLSGGIK